MWWKRSVPERAFIAESELDKIRQATLLLLGQSVSPDDLEKLSAAYQNISEVENREREKARQQRILRMEGWKSFATVTVPLLTLITLAVTIYLQNSQIQATREANEDTQWRQTLKSFSVRHNDPLADLTADAGLKSFYNSTRYASQAYAMTPIMLGHMADAEGFRDLYSAAYGAAGWVNIYAIADIDRDLTKSYWEIDDQISDQDKPLPASVVAQFGGDPSSARDALNHYHGEFLAELEFLTSEICSTLRTARTKDWAKATLDLSNTFILNGNCTNADFSHVDLSLSRIESVQLNGAKLQPIAYSSSRWIQSPWWNAAIIERGLLLYLRDENFPYRAAGEYADEDSAAHAPVKRDYVSRVTSLCKADNVNCNPVTIPFGTPSPLPKHP